jgi:hypothetical protein
MATASKSSSGFWFLVGGVFLIFAFAIAVRTLLTLNPPAPPEDSARAAERTKAYEELQKENAVKLGTFAWVDKAKGQVQIPIELAMEMTVAELAQRPPAPAGPINPPPADAAAASPAAPASSAAPEAAAEPAATPAAQPAPAN